MPTCQLPFAKSMMNKQISIKEEPVVGSKNLYLIFGGIAAGIAMPPFEFYKSAQILNENRVFIRDFRQSWYHAGLEGISKDIPSTVQYLKELIIRYSPSETVIIGNSMGGFAAILFTALIGNARAIAFCPRIFIGPWNRLKNRDKRYEKLIYRMYLKTLFKKKHYDLAKLEPNSTWSADIYVSRSDRLDIAHARHIAQHPRVTIHEYEQGGHELVKSLRDSGELAAIIQTAPT